MDYDKAQEKEPETEAPECRREMQGLEWEVMMNYTRSLKFRVSS